MKIIEENSKLLLIECNCGKSHMLEKKKCQETSERYNIDNPIKCKCGEIIEFVEKLPNKEIKCPKCNSTQLTTNDKGFGLGKAAIGGILLGSVGLLGGLIGSKKVMITCLKCGYKWEAGT